MIVNLLSICFSILICNCNSLKTLGLHKAYERFALQSLRPKLSPIHSLTIIKSLVSLHCSTKDELTYFYGPEQSFEEMIAGVQNEELGIDVMVGSSTIPTAGLGVFVCVSDGIESSEVKRGTPLVGYSKGTFIDHALDMGDKTVAFLINRPNAAVFFEKELMTIKDSVCLVADRHNVQDMEDVLLGHKLFYDSEAQDIAFAPDESFVRRYFVPNEVAANLSEGVCVSEAITDGVSPNDVFYGIDVSNMGMYFNDLAYSPGISETEYRQQSAEKNAVAIVWRLEDNDGILIPTWPVVVSTRRLVFTNSCPMEMGLEYNYKYWAAAEAKEKESEDKDK